MTGDAMRSSGKAGCPEPDTLAAWIDGRLDDQEHQAEVSRHVDACSACGWVVSRPSTATSGQRRQALRVGTKLGRYRLDDELGRGAMGIVYRGYDPDLRRSVAIKVTQPPEDVDVDHYRARLMAEAETLADADDPCVVRIYDVGGREDGLIYIVMELVVGETGRRWCSHRQASDITQMMLAVGSALGRLHDRGLVHGDIKPENLMIDSDGRPRLVDFGLARSRKPNTERTSDGSEPPRLRAPGTPGYMAPEQLAGDETQATPAADQYAWATTFFEMLSGQRPFKGTSVLELTEDKQHGTPPLTALPRAQGVRAILRRALAPRPADRWPSLTHAVRARSRKRFTGVAIVGAAVVAVTTFGVVRSSAQCEVPQLNLHTGLPRIDARMDGWQQSWTQSARASCALDEPNGAAARDCLSDARLAATAIVERLSEGSAPKASGVEVAMVEDLIAPQLCLNVRSVPVAVAEDPARELALRREVQRSWVAYRYRPDAEAAAVLLELDRRADEDGMGRVLARIRMLRGVGERQHGDPQKARELLEDALGLARDHRMDSMVADVWLQRLILEALHLRDPEEVERITRFLDAHLEDALEPGVLAGRRDIALAAWHAERKEHELAAQRMTAALSALEDAHNRLYYAEALEAAGVVLALAGDAVEAWTWLERARVRYREVLGAGSAREITLTSNLAALANTELRWADAERLAREGLALEADMNPTFEASLHSTLGRTLCHAQSSPEAIEHLRRALAIRGDRFDVSHQVVTSARFHLAACLAQPETAGASPSDDALREADALVGRIRAHIDAADLDRVFQARIMHLQGRVALYQGRHADALRWCEDARTRLQGLPEPGTPADLIESCIDRARLGPNPPPAG